jgi:hypothetical protein
MAYYKALAEIREPRFKVETIGYVFFAVLMVQTIVYISDMFRWSFGWPLSSQFLFPVGTDMIQSIFVNGCFIALKSEVLDTMLK